MTEGQLIGQTLGPFEILSELGRGGMAIVYKARQVDLQRIVALKILPPELSRDQSSLQRFLHEARSAAALEHPHIMPIYAIGQAQGFHYIAMKFIDGRTLKDIAQEQGALDLPQTAALLEQVASALDYAHGKGMIHRDIKPSNMMAEPNGWVYLTDFGLARGGESSQGLTLAGTVMGTPEYMSPEQAQGLATIGPATDIYALGVVVYEMLTGKVPFSADTPMGMLIARLQYAPRPPSDYRGDLPSAVEDVIMRALARRPEARYATAGELVAALKAAAGLGTRSLAPQQRPISPAMGVPAATQPTSPAWGMPTAQRPASPAAGIPAIPNPPSPPSSPGTTTPPLVAARPATPLAQPAAAFGNLPTAPAAPAVAAPPAQRSRRGLWLGLGAVALLLIIGFGTLLFVTRGPDPAIAKGLQEGKAAIAQPNGLDPAISAYKRVLNAAPNNIEAHNQLSLIYTLRDQPKLAETEARAALAVDSRSAMASALLAAALSNQEKNTEALTSANQAIQLDSSLSFAYSTRAEIQAGLGQENSDPDRFDDAEHDADQGIQLAKANDPLSQALAHSAQGYVAYQRFSYTNDTDTLDQGIDALKQAIDIQGQLALFHSNLGYFYDARGKHDEAQQAFEQALTVDDQYGHTHAGLGWNLYYLDDYTGALSEFEKALAINQEDIDAYLGKSAVYQQQTTPDFDTAANTLEQAANIAPSNPSVPANQGWLRRAQANTLKNGSDEQKKAYAEAEQHFRQALTINEKFVDALTGLGWVLQDQGLVADDQQKFNESVETLKKSLALKEQQPSANNALGWSYYSLKRYDDAKDAFQRAIDLSSDYANAYYGLGRSLQELGKNDQARDAYQQAIKYGSTDAQNALSALK